MIYTCKFHMVLLNVCQYLCNRIKILILTRQYEMCAHFCGMPPFSKWQLHSDENIMLVVSPFECLALVLECYFASSQLGFSFFFFNATKVLFFALNLNSSGPSRVGFLFTSQEQKWFRAWHYVVYMDATLAMHVHPSQPRPGQNCAHTKLTNWLSLKHVFGIFRPFSLSLSLSLSTNYLTRL